MNSSTSLILLCNHRAMEFSFSELTVLFLVEKCGRILMVIL